MGIEEFLEEAGGFGRFQMILIATLYINKLSVSWSMLQMSFAGFIPEWHCGTVSGRAEIGRNGMNNGSFIGHGVLTAQRDNSTIGKCTVNNTWTSFERLPCDSFHFDPSAVTAVTEWDLVCDQKYIKSLLTSVQMAGVLVGAFISGQLADVVGRKKTFYGFCLLHVLANLATAFSPTWQVFAAGRFVIGIGIGAVLVVAFAFPMEFQPVKWRPILSILPTWVIGIAIFALSAMLMNNWSHLHIGCAVIGTPGLFGYFLVPESVRWLSVNGRLQEAHHVCERVASANRKPLPAYTKAMLEKIYQEELESRKSAKKYSYIDVFRGWAIFKITTTFCYFWFGISLIYYGISFAVSGLAGNLYLNIFTLAAVELPASLTTFYFVNRNGRKKTAFALLLVATLASLGSLITHFAASPATRGPVVTGLSVITKMGVGAGWTVMQTWGLELYPTVTRNLGYGAANTAARVGGIIAPFAIDFDSATTRVISYCIILFLAASISTLILLTPETKGRVLADSMQGNGKDKTTKTENFQNNLNDSPYVGGENPTTGNFPNAHGQTNSVFSVELPVKEWQTAKEQTKPQVSVHNNNEENATFYNVKF